MLGDAIALSIDDPGLLLLTSKIEWLFVIIIVFLFYKISKRED